MEQNILSNAGKYSVAAIVGMVVAAILNLGIFATRAELAEQRAFMAETYATKAEVASEVQDTRDTLKEMNRKIDRLLEKK